MRETRAARELLRPAVERTPHQWSVESKLICGAWMEIFCGGVAEIKSIKRIVTTNFFIVCLLAAIPQGAIAASDAGTLTKGQTRIACIGFAGFISGTLGSYSPTGLTGGTTVCSVDDYLASPVTCSGGLVHRCAFPGSRQIQHRAG